MEKGTTILHFNMIDKVAKGGGISETDHHCQSAFHFTNKWLKFCEKQDGRVHGENLPNLEMDFLPPKWQLYSVAPTAACWLERSPYF